MDSPPERRFGFLVSEIARLYAQQFDREAVEKLGLSQAQFRLLHVLSSHDRGDPPSQAALAERIGVSAMAVATMCDRLAAGGWLERRPAEQDRRVNRLHLQPKARKALQRARALADDLTGRVLAGLDDAERTQLLELLARARDGLLGGAPS